MKTNTTTRRSLPKPGPKAPARDDTRDQILGRGLGLFSLCLGAAEIAAPRAMARLIGVPDNPALFRAVGLREIVSGVGLLAAPKEPGWRWARVAGDLMDLALLGSAASRPGADRAKATGAALAVVGVTAVDLAAGASGERHDGAPASKPVRAVVTVDRSAEECFTRWSDPGVLARVLTLVDSIRDDGEGKTHWTVRVGKGTAEWDAKEMERVPNERLTWRTVPGSRIEASSTVRFAPAAGGRGTIVTLDLNVPSAGGLAGRIFGGAKAKKDLLRFKQFMELGFIPSADGPSGARGPVGKLLEKAED